MVRFPARLASLVETFKLVDFCVRAGLFCQCCFCCAKGSFGGTGGSGCARFRSQQCHHLNTCRKKQKMSAEPAGANSPETWTLAQI